MRKNILITGAPKSGKSTLLGKVISDIPNKTGFVTNEIRQGEGRVGFEIETSSGDKTVLSHIDFKTPFKVSKYFVDVLNLDKIIPKVSKFKENDILYLDEIGEMQLFSKNFEGLVLNYLDSKNIVLASLSQIYQNFFTDVIRKRKDIIIIELTENNRLEKEKFVRLLIKKIEKAQRYANEPERFFKNDDIIEVKSEHGLRKLILKDGVIFCNCDFYNEHKICSHTLAAEEIYKM